MQSIKIGSRGSDLALWQANYLKDSLEDLGMDCTVKVIETQGDRVQDLGFDKMEGKGFFTKEIEAALIQKEIDLAVHSYKDLPTESPPGLIIAANSARGNPMDWLVIDPQSATTDRPYRLPENAVVGTSSARRKSQMKSLSPGLTLQDIRGNVPTRLKKLREGDFDALVMAAAGLERLGIDQSEYVIYTFTPDEFVPAPAQGVLAFQCREQDETLSGILKQIHHRDTFDCISAERYVLNKMGGGCHLPLGAYCMKEGPLFILRCSWGSGTKSDVKRIKLSGDSPQQLAEQAVLTLKEYT